MTIEELNELRGQIALIVDAATEYDRKEDINGWTVICQLYSLIDAEIERQYEIHDCKYCEYPEAITQVGCDTHIQIKGVGLTVDIFDEELQSGGLWATFEINYCPFCGRRLEEEI